MAERKYTLFLEKIIQYTKDSRIKWKYLDSNEKLYMGMNWADIETIPTGLFSTKNIAHPDFDVDASFYAEENGMYIVILVRNNDPATIYVIPDTYKKVVTLQADEYGDLITRLLNLVQEQFPDADRFINKFLENDE